MTFTEAVSLNWSVMECGECGVLFQVSEGLRAEWQRTGRGWYCPNGHSRVYRETTEQKLRKELAAEKAASLALRERALRAERLRDAAEKQTKRLKKRVANGVCPCCNRTFQNLGRHMNTKHPGYEKQEIG